MIYFQDRDVHAWAYESELPDKYPIVLGTGDRGVKGPTAGLVWIKFDYLESESPSQVVGHTRQSRPQTKGNVHCQDFLLKNRGSPGGQGVFVETPDPLVALRRDSTQDVTAETLG